MRKSRYTKEQIRLAVQQAEAGLDLTEICRDCTAATMKWCFKSRLFRDLSDPLNGG